MINESIFLLEGYYRDVQGNLRSRKIKSLTSSAERNRPYGRFHRWHLYSAIREVNLIGTKVTPTPMFPCVPEKFYQRQPLFLLCYICIFRYDINAPSFPAMNVVVHINKPIFCSQFTVSNSSNANYSVQLFLVQLHGILGHLIYFSLERHKMFWLSTCICQLHTNPCQCFHTGTAAGLLLDKCVSTFVCDFESNLLFWRM